MTNKSVKILILAPLIVASYGFVIYRIIKFTELKGINEFLIFQPEKLLLLLTAIMLMFLNWSTEALKWKTLIRKVPVSFSTAFKVVISGITLGIFTPNRIGEIGGRAALLDKGNRTYGILAASLGSFAQFSTTLFNGFIGLILFLILLPHYTIISPLMNKISVFVLLLLLLILFAGYFNAKLLKPVLLKFSFFKSRTLQLDHFSNTSYQLLTEVLLLSIFRYGIFFTQFYLLLLFFDIHLQLWQAYTAISLIYLFATLIPTTLLIELGIRSSLSIFFLGMFSENSVGILLSTMLLWIINLGIPTLWGSVFLIKKIVKKRIKYIHLHN